MLMNFRMVHFQVHNVCLVTASLFLSNWIASTLGERWLKEGKLLSRTVAKFLKKNLEIRRIKQ